MIDNNLLVTLYGKTGIGKTSILNAGVFPLLRSRKYLPISVRLGKNDKNISFAKSIVDEITKEIQNIGGKEETKFPNNTLDNYLSIESLWKYFATTTFYNAEGVEVYPVIALDQIEEIFISKNQDATLLMKQINALVDDNRVIPDDEGYSNSTNYRFVISIREDDLFYLEDCIDINYLSLLKQNRYRLCPMSDLEAHEVVMLGSELMEKGTENEMAVRITNLAKDNSGHVSTNILSLICSQLFIQSNGVLSLDFINNSFKDPLKNFCLDCFSNVSECTRTFVENHLVDGERRKFIREDEIQRLPSRDIKILMDGQYKILQTISVGNTKCIELIHDTIAMTICHIKMETEERKKSEILQKQNKRKKCFLWLLSAILVGALIVILYLFTQKNNVASNINFAINISENADVIEDNDFWHAELRVYGICRNDTIFNVIKPIDKSNFNLSLDYNADTADKVRIALLFADQKKYQDIDTILNVNYLSQHPSVNLCISKRMKRHIIYSSKVVARVCDKVIPLQDAIVILRDKIQRINALGDFSFDFEDSISSSDVLYVVRKGFDSFVASNLINEGNLQPEYELTLTESWSQDFENECLYFDTIDRNTRSHIKDHKKIWVYHTGGGKRICYESSDNKGDRLIMNCTGVRTVDGRYQIKGYYYYFTEYNALSESEKHKSYYIVNGWMDTITLSKKVPNKKYEFEGVDLWGNKQKIIGLYDFKHGLQGTIFNCDGEYAQFGY